MNIPADATRIDFERQNANVVTSIWLGRWPEGSAPAIVGFEERTRIETLLAECEKAGFTVEMMDAVHGRALRGRITRVDVLEIVAGEWHIRKYPHGWTARTRPLEEKIVSATYAKEAIEWMKLHGWTVREFPGGARGWNGEAKPVRDRSTIVRMRSQVRSSYFRRELDPRQQFDLAFDC